METRALLARQALVRDVADEDVFEDVLVVVGHRRGETIEDELPAAERLEGLVDIGDARKTSHGACPEDAAYD